MTNEEIRENEEIRDLIKKILPENIEELSFEEVETVGKTSEGFMSELEEVAYGGGFTKTESLLKQIEHIFENEERRKRRSRLQALAKEREDEGLHFDEASRAEQEKRLYKKNQCVELLEGEGEFIEGSIGYIHRVLDSERYNGGSAYEIVFFSIICGVDGETYENTFEEEAIKACPEPPQWFTAEIKVEGGFVVHEGY